MFRRSRAGPPSKTNPKAVDEVSKQGEDGYVDSHPDALRGPAGNAVRGEAGVGDPDQPLAKVLGEKGRAAAVGGGKGVREKKECVNNLLVYSSDLLKLPSPMPY